jgi:N-acetylglutamate synthase-like GNAT family acetyltransferase
MIKKIIISEIDKYLPYAKKNGLIFCNKTTLYGLYVNNEIVAFTGIIFYKNKAIFKNHYVPIKNRGNGYFKTLLEYSINLCSEMKINVIEATCTKMSIKEYLKRGFQITKQYKLYTKVRYENI